MTVGERLQFWKRIGQAAAAYVFYLSKSLYPVNLAIVYPWGPDDLPLGEVLGALAPAGRHYRSRCWPAAASRTSLSVGYGSW